MNPDDTKEHIPVEPTPISGELIAGPAADIIGALKERVEELEGREKVYQSITTGFASILANVQLAVPFSAFEAFAGASISMSPVEDAGMIVYSVVWPEEAAGEQ